VRELEEGIKKKERDQQIVYGVQKEEIKRLC
jgi:hypothetical protein